MSLNPLFSVFLQDQLVLCQAKDRLLLVLIVNVAQDLQQASLGHLRTFSVSKHVLLTHICI